MWCRQGRKWVCKGYGDVKCGAEQELRKARFKMFPPSVHWRPIDVVG